MAGIMGAAVTSMIVVTILPVLVAMALPGPGGLRSFPQGIMRFSYGGVIIQGAEQMSPTKSITMESLTLLVAMTRHRMGASGIPWEHTISQVVVLSTCTSMP